MKTLSRILGINLILLLVYSILLTASTNTGLNIFAVSMVQACVNLVMGAIFFINDKAILVKAFIVSMLIIPILGLSVCLGFLS